jgi:tRNA threonylcarbamoyl adenosine modification protein YjeE
MKYIAENLRQTAKIAADFALNLSLTTNKATVVGLYGELGSGKTSFTQSVSTVLGVTETVVSPTFVIEKIYELPKTKTDGQKKCFQTSDPY